MAGSYTDGIASLIVGTIAQTGPDFPEWEANGTYLRFDIGVDMFEGVDAVAWVYASGGEVYAYVEVPETGAVCDAVPNWGALPGGQGYIGITFAGSSGTGDGTSGVTGGGDRPSGDARPGYWMLGRDGSVWGFGPASEHTGGRQAPAVFQAAAAIASTPSGAGYWVVDTDGTIHATGDATPFTRAALAPAERATSLSVTPDGGGLWVFTDRGRVVTRGSAPSFGDASGLALNGPIVGSVATPSGLGYYLVGSDGGVFSYGDARFAGSMGGRPLNAPVNGLVPDADGSGYWLVASDGGVFAFGAPFRGAMPPVRVNRPVVGMVAYGDGYLMVGADGGIFTFSSSPFHGSLGANPPAVPIVGVAVQADVPSVASASYEAAAAGWSRLNRDNDGWYHGWYWDGDGDGLVEYVYLDDGEDGFHEVVLRDSNENSRIDQLWVDVEQNGAYEGSAIYHYQGYGGNFVTQEVQLDRNQNGRFEIGYYDGDRNGTYELIKQDTNGDDYADTWYQNTASSGTTYADSLARNVSNVSAVNILHGAGLSVFFP